MSQPMRPSRGAAWLIGLELGVFLIYVFSGDATRHRLLGWLALSPGALKDGHVWKLITTSLLSIRGLALFFDLLMLWLFVPILENFWGTRRFVTFVVVTSVLGNLAAALVGMAVDPEHLIIGLSPFIYASIAAFGVVYAREPVQFFGIIPIRGRQLAIGMVCFLGVFVLLERSWVDGAGYFTAILTALGITSGIWQPNVWWLKYRRWRRRYTVINGGKASDLTDRVGQGNGRNGRGGKSRWMN